MQVESSYKKKKNTFIAVTVELACKSDVDHDRLVGTSPFICAPVHLLRASAKREASFLCMYDGSWILMRGLVGQNLFLSGQVFRFGAWLI